MQIHVRALSCACYSLWSIPVSDRLGNDVRIFHVHAWVFNSLYLKGGVPNAVFFCISLLGVARNPLLLYKPAPM